MRQLYIDGKPAVIKSGSSFKFYRENIYFTEAEDYTLDVTLPLRGCSENLAIFSAIHRPEMSAVHLIGKKYPFHFIAPPLDIEGSAIVTEINETDVKVQLLAGSTGVDSAVYILTHIHPSLIVHRLTGDCPRDLLIAPEWNRNKNEVISAIVTKMQFSGLAQGSKYGEF